MSCEVLALEMDLERFISTISGVWKHQQYVWVVGGGLWVAGWASCFRFCCQQPHKCLANLKFMRKAIIKIVVLAMKEDFQFLNYKMIDATPTIFLGRVIVDCYIVHRGWQLPQGSCFCLCYQQR